MATVCVRVQSAEKCLVSWTIFQTESDSHSLLELFENVKNGRVSSYYSAITRTQYGTSKESFHRKIQRDPYKYRSKYSTL